MEASIKEREKEVQQSLANSLRERDKERDQHKKEEAVQHFKALLVDMASLEIISSILHGFAQHNDCVGLVKYAL